MCELLILFYVIQYYLNKSKIKLFHKALKVEKMHTSFSSLLERFLNSDELLYRSASTNVSFISRILALYKFHLSFEIGGP